MSFFYKRSYSKKRALRLVSLFAVLPLLLLFFQNCSPSSIQNLLSLNAASHKDSGGNGEPYDGKPSYSRLVPGLTCDDKNIAIGTLDIHGNTATVITNQNSCQNVSTEISISDLEFSSFSKKYIGYQDGVYTYLENRDETIAKGIFTEAWCRAMKTDSSVSAFEFAAEWQEDGQAANLSIFSEKDSDSLPVPSQRILDIDRVSYQTNEGGLVIYFKQKIPGTRKFSGAYSGKIDGVDNQNINVECLMGGQFDPIAPQFTFSGPSNKTISIGEPITDLVPVVNKSVRQYSLDQELPNGLQFNTQTGAIFGSATELMPRKSYTISAQFSYGKIAKPISIGVGQVQVVDTLSPSVNNVPCTNKSSACDIYGAVALANSIWPTPLIVKINLSSLSLQGESLSLHGDLTLLGNQSTQTTIDAQLRSQHINVLPQAYLELNNLKLINGREIFGGSISAANATVIIKSTNFSNNRADKDLLNGGNGGALFINQGSLEILNSDFINNQTTVNGSRGNGGAIYLENAKYTSIKDSRFISNTSRLGGALYVNIGVSRQVSISGSRFESNKSTDGGALSAYLTDISIDSSQFIKNESVFEGGALAFHMGSRSWVSNSLFDGNRGSGFGSAAIYWQGNEWSGYHGQYSALYVLESKFINHTSMIPNAGVILDFLGQVVLRGSELNNNGSLKNCSTAFDAPTSLLISLGGNNSSDNTCPK